MTEDVSVKTPGETRRGEESRRERGAVSLKLLLSLLLLGAIGYALYLYVPVAYEALLFKDFMHETVNKSISSDKEPETWAGRQLREGIKQRGLPADAAVTTQKVNGQVSARVSWSRPIEFPGYTYVYEFDHTATSDPRFAGN